MKFQRTLAGYGMQIAIIEFARNIVGLKDAHSGEFEEQCVAKVIDFMPEAVYLWRLYGDVI